MTIKMVKFLLDFEGRSQAHARDVFMTPEPLRQISRLEQTDQAEKRSTQASVPSLVVFRTIRTLDRKYK